MATVYLGKQRGDADFVRAVAIKRLHPQFARSEEFSVCLLDEARLASRIHHPNVVPILDVVRSNGELLMVMEYVVGESLAHLLEKSQERKAAVPIDVAVSIIVDTLRGLHAAHIAKDARGRWLGIVHRDVSSHNILVGLDGVARVFDFGIAKALGNAQLTRPGQIKGTLAYMSPEQLLGKQVGPTSDVFAAAVVLWEALAGYDLFARDDESATVSAVLQGVVPALHETAGVPLALDAALARALDREPERRFQTALEFAAALEACVRPAGAARVGDWVTWLVGGELEQRRVRLASVEKRSSPDYSRALIEQARSLRQSAAGGSSEPPMQPRARYGTALVIAAVAGLAAAAGLAAGRGSWIVPQAGSIERFAGVAAVLLGAIAVVLVFASPRGAVARSTAVMRVFAGALSLAALVGGLVTAWGWWLHQLQN
jgi:serine/threonine-protein kinase